MSDKIKILLVDDEKSIRFLVKECIGQEFDLECCESLAQAVLMSASGDWDAVILDLGLPDSEGIESFRHIKEAFLDTPIIILTAREDQNISCQAIREGAQDYIFKSEMEIIQIGRSVIHAIERQKFLLKAKEAAENTSGCMNRLTQIMGALDG